MAALIFPVQSMAIKANNVENLMTFFTTPNERNKLDAMRNKGQFDNKSTIKGSAVSIIPEPTKIELKGVMTRENGKAVVWINNGNTLKSNRIDQQISVKTRSIKKGQLNISLKASQQRLRMKPGQQWNESDNKIIDKYQTK
jgi:hypothetical protein